MNKKIAALKLLVSIDRQLQAQGRTVDLVAESRLEKQRALVRRRIAASLLTTYDALMRAGRYPPFVEARGSHCGGCNLRLTPQLAHEIRRGESLPACPHCRRLLFSESRRVASASGRLPTTRFGLRHSRPIFRLDDSPH